MNLRDLVHAIAWRVVRGDTTPLGLDGFDVGGNRLSEEILPGGTTVYRRHTPNGSLLEEEWKVGSALHRIDGPARRLYFVDGPIEVEEWHFRGQRHRVGGPAETVWSGTGSIDHETYFRHGKIERLDGPASIRYPSIAVGVWLVFGEKCDGPAEVAYELRTAPKKDAKNAIRHSVFAPLLREKFSIAEIADAIAAGITTLEGVRELRAGAPADWVRAFESGETLGWSSSSSSPR